MTLTRRQLLGAGGGYAAALATQHLWLNRWQVDDTLPQRIRDQHAAGGGNVHIAGRTEIVLHETARLPLTAHTGMGAVTLSGDGPGAVIVRAGDESLPTLIGWQDNYDPAITNSWWALNQRISGMRLIRPEGGAALEMPRLAGVDPALTKLHIDLDSITVEAHGDWHDTAGIRLLGTVHMSRFRRVRGDVRPGPLDPCLFEFDHDPAYPNPYTNDRIGVAYSRFEQCQDIERLSGHTAFFRGRAYRCTFADIVINGGRVGPAFWLLDSAHNRLESVFTEGRIDVNGTIRLTRGWGNQFDLLQLGLSAEEAGPGHELWLEVTRWTQGRLVAGWPGMGASSLWGHRRVYVDADSSDNDLGTVQVNRWHVANEVEDLGERNTARVVAAPGV